MTFAVLLALLIAVGPFAAVLPPAAIAWLEFRPPARAPRFRLSAPAPRWAVTRCAS